MRIKASKFSTSTVLPIRVISHFPKRDAGLTVTLVTPKTSSLSEFAVSNTGRFATLEFSRAKCSTFGHSRLRVTKPHTRRVCLAAAGGADR